MADGWLLAVVAVAQAVVDEILEIVAIMITIMTALPNASPVPRWLGVSTGATCKTEG